MSRPDAAGNPPVPCDPDRPDHGAARPPRPTTNRPDRTTNPPGAHSAAHPPKPATRQPAPTTNPPSAHSAAARPDRGSATLELAILAPGLLLLVALIALAGRYAIADGAVDQAAAEAARAASLQRTPSAGRDAAADVARAALAEQGLSCLRTQIDVDVSGLRAPPGRRGRVTVTIRCPLRVADLPLHVPAITLTATAVSPVDTYRER